MLRLKRCASTSGTASGRKGRCLRKPAFSTIRWSSARRSAHADSLYNTKATRDEWLLCCSVIADTDKDRYWINGQEISRTGITGYRAGCRSFQSTHNGKNNSLSGHQPEKK